MESELTYNDYKEYLYSQTKICFNCDLFIDKKEHGSKIIMLFAEVFPFLSNIYGITKVSNLIIQYINTPVFKYWFWKIKHTLGQYLACDPTFDDIGKWIGKGFFLKISLSLLIYHKLIINENTINNMILKQKKLLKEFSNENISYNNKNIIEIDKDSYILLNEKIITSYENEYFYHENIIK
jgi:hypothetical protein